MRAIVKEIFGDDVKVMLFGSRVDDNKRGGDFDVFVETDIREAGEVVQKKLDCLARLHASPEFEDEKIDLLVSSRVEGAMLPIHQAARAQGIPL